MGTVLEFRSVRATKIENGETVLDRTGARPCEVVIFPGVRIERHSETRSHVVRDVLIVDATRQDWARDS